MTGKRYLILMTSTKIKFFVDGVVLEGEKNELMRKLRSDTDFVRSLGISETIIGEKYKLVEEDTVAFPEEKNG